MTERFSVAAVVVTYNRLPLLRQCLAALAAQTAQDLTIFLVDNASTDGTAEAVAEMALPNLVYHNTGKTWAGQGASPTACGRLPLPGTTPSGSWTTTPCPPPRRWKPFTGRPQLARPIRLAFQPCFSARRH